MFHAADYHQTDAETIAWIVTLAVVGALATVINLLTLYTFLSAAALRSRKHVMIMNLAAADALFGVTGIPVYLVYLIRPQLTLFYVWVMASRFCKIASLFTLGVIAVERMHAIVCPLRHKTLSRLVFNITIASIWICASALTVSGLVVLFRNVDIITFLSLASVFTPVLTITVVLVIGSCYIFIWVSYKRRRFHAINPSTIRERSLALTLLLVSGAFLVTWCPPLLYLSVIPNCIDCIQPNIQILDWFVLVFGIQCLVNPAIYCYRLPLFKVSLKAVIKRVFVKCFHPCCNTAPKNSSIRPGDQKVQELQKQPKVECN